MLREIIVNDDINEFTDSVVDLMCKTTGATVSKLQLNHSTTRNDGLPEPCVSSGNKDSYKAAGYDVKRASEAKRDSF